MKSIANKLLLLLAALFFLNKSPIYSQDIIPHFMNKLPQTSNTNVSYFPEYEYTGAIPFLGHNKVNLVSNFSFSNLIDGISDGSAVFNLEKALTELPDLSFLYGENTFNIVTSTWKRHDWYFTFNMANHIDFDVRIPKDLLVLGWKGNQEFMNQAANLNGLGADMIQYNEISLGVSQNISKIKIGSRIKILQGLLNLNTYSSNFDLKSDTSGQLLQGSGQMDLRFSGPFDTNGWVVYDYTNYFFNPLNVGFGVDVGISTRLFNKLKLSADLIDLGKIKWDSKPKHIIIDKNDIRFGGIKIDSLLSFSMSDSGTTSLLDTTQTIFDPTRTDESYTTYLSPKLYLMASFNLNEKNTFGLIYYQRFNKSYTYSSVSFLYKKWFGDIVSATVKYSILSTGYQKFGAGLMFRIQGLNFYFISEDLGAVFKPLNSRNINLSFGMNIVRYSDDSYNNIRLK